MAKLNFSDTLKQVLGDAPVGEPVIVAESVEPIEEISKAELSALAAAAVAKNKDKIKKIETGTVSNLDPKEVKRAMRGDGEKASGHFYEKKSKEDLNPSSTFKGTYAGAKYKGNVRNEEELEYQVGDVLEAEDGSEGVVTAVSEAGISVEWQEGENVVEQIIPLDEISKCKVTKYLDKTEKKNPFVSGGEGKDTKDRTKGRSAAFKKLSKDKRSKVPATNEEENIGEPEMTTTNEETVAASSLHPAAQSISDPQSKLEALNAVLGVFAKMEKTEIVDFFNKSLAQIGQEAVNIPGGSAEKNKHSVDMKTVAKEDVADLFGGEEITEEFRDKATTLFEAAVNSRVILETERLVEEYEVALNEELEEIYTSLNEKVEDYLEAAAQTWLEDNAIAIESSLRNEITDDFITGLKNLFNESYIDIPEEKVSVVESLIEKTEALEAKLDALISENAELESALVESIKEAALLEASKGLPLDQAERFKALSESVDFDGDETKYLDRLNTIKEAHFAKRSATGPNVQNLNEDYVDELPELAPRVNPDMDKYVKTISRTK